MSIVYSSLNHALRVPLAAEAHSRPFLRLDVPETLTHLAVYAQRNGDTNADSAAAQHALLAALCGHFGATAPAAEARHFFHDFGRFRLKWESHAEFATYTFAEHHEQAQTIGEAFDNAPLYHVPQEWLLGLQGKIIVAAHLVLDQSPGPADAFAHGLRAVFEGTMVVGSRVLQGGEVWTDFLIQSDGFSRFVVRDVGLREQQAGRLAQRLLEIETYRMMALLGLPHAQRATPALNAIEGELATLTAAMVDSDAALADAASGRLAEEGDSDQVLLDEITGLAARIEKLSLDNNYRFAASKAYFGLVNARIEELRETRIEGFPTMSEFMERRMRPAMHTCEATARRQEALAERIARTNDLLRTRVGIVQERQNRRILQSMNERAAQQLRLQQAVEGLSVAAISYYVAGLFHYAVEAAESVGMHVNADIATGALVPLIAVGVWFGLQRLHKSVHAAG